MRGGWEPTEIRYRSLDHGESLPVEQPSAPASSAPADSVTSPLTGIPSPSPMTLTRFSLALADWTPYGTVHRGSYSSSYPPTLHSSSYSSTSSPYSPPPSLGLSPLSSTRTTYDHLAGQSDAGSLLPASSTGKDAQVAADHGMLDNDVRFSSEILLSLARGTGLGINLGPPRDAVGSDQVRRISDSTQDGSDDELEVRTHVVGPRGLSRCSPTSALLLSHYLHCHGL